MKKRILSLALAGSMATSMLPAASLAADVTFDDTHGHWAESSISRWSDYKIVEGYDGHFNPDDNLTRGQMAKIIANTMGLTDEGTSNPFADLDLNAWYAPYILRCYAAGIMQGDGKNANPESTITRAETMTLLGRALGIDPLNNADLSAYGDAGDVADWAKGYVAAMVKAGIINGTSDGLLAPSLEINRATIMTILDRSITQFINAPGTYELAGEGLVLVTCGGVTLTGTSSANLLVTPGASGGKVTFKKAVMTGNITVQGDNVKVISSNSKLPTINAVGEGVTISKPSSGGGGGGSSSGGNGGGTTTNNTYTITSDAAVLDGTDADKEAVYDDITISDTVGDGEVTLKNLTINGTLTVNGGGDETIRFFNITFGPNGRIIVNKPQGKTPRLYFKNTPVNTIEVKGGAGAKIEASDNNSPIGNVEASSNVYIAGNDTVIKTVTVKSDDSTDNTDKDVNINVTDGATVGSVDAKNSTYITGDDTATVGTVNAEAPVTVSSNVVDNVTVPDTVKENIEIKVTGTGSIDVTANTDKEVQINADDQTKVSVSTDNEDGNVNAKVNNETVTHAHKWNDGEVTKAATCTENGTKTYTCTADGCGETPATKTETIAKLGHVFSTEGKQTKAPTCEGNGQMTYTCTRENCNGEKVVEIAALGHSWNTAWTVSEEAHWHTCANDCGNINAEGAARGKHVDENKDDKCDTCGYDMSCEHVFGEWTVVAEATCTKAGSETHTCSKCGTVETKTTAATGHNWGEAETTKKPTCTNPGEETKTCATCGEKETSEVAKLGHKKKDAVQENIVSATCTTAGSYDLVVYCATCGKELSRETKTIPKQEETINPNPDDGSQNPENPSNPGDGETENPGTEVTAPTVSSTTFAWSYKNNENDEQSHNRVLKFVFGSENGLDKGIKALKATIEATVKDSTSAADTEGTADGTTYRITVTENMPSNENTKVTQWWFSIDKSVDGGQQVKWEKKEGETYVEVSSENLPFQNDNPQDSHVITLTSVSLAYTDSTEEGAKWTTLESISSNENLLNKEFKYEAPTSESPDGGNDEDKDNKDDDENPSDSVNITVSKASFAWNYTHGSGDNATQHDRVMDFVFGDNGFSNTDTKVKGLKATFTAVVPTTSEAKTTGEQEYTVEVIEDVSSATSISNWYFSIDHTNDETGEGKGTQTVTWTKKDENTSTDSPFMEHNNLPDYVTISNVQLYYTTESLSTEADEAEDSTDKWTSISLGSLTSEKKTVEGTFCAAPSVDNASFAWDYIQEETKDSTHHNRVMKFTFTNKLSSAIKGLKATITLKVGDQEYIAVATEDATFDKLWWFCIDANSAHNMSWSKSSNGTAEADAEDANPFQSQSFWNPGGLEITNVGLAYTTDAAENKSERTYTTIDLSDKTDSLKGTYTPLKSATFQWEVKDDSQNHQHWRLMTFEMANSARLSDIKALKATFTATVPFASTSTEAEQQDTSTESYNVTVTEDITNGWTSGKWYFSIDKGLENGQTVEWEKQIETATETNDSNKQGPFYSQESDNVPSSVTISNVKLYASTESTSKTSDWVEITIPSRGDSFNVNGTFPATESNND